MSGGVELVGRGGHRSCMWQTVLDNRGFDGVVMTAFLQVGTRASDCYGVTHSQGQYTATAVQLVDLGAELDVLQWL